MARESLDHFEHDTDARNHPKFKALRASFGWEGVGRFWALNEMIGGAAHARLDLSKKVYRATAAEDLGLTIQAFEAFLSFLSDPEECGLLSYYEGIVTTDRTSENWEALKAYRDKEKDRKASSAGKGTVSSGKAPVSSGTPAETPEKPAENRPSSVKSSSVKLSTEEFAGSAEAAPEKPTPESKPIPDDFEPTLDPAPPSTLQVPSNIKLSAKDLGELQSRFGTRSQEALDKIGLLYAAKDYGYKNHWAGVKLWLAEHTSATAWLDKANGKGGAAGPTAKPADTRSLNEPPVPEDERVDLGAFSPEDFLRRSDDDFEPRAEGA